MRAWQGREQESRALAEMTAQWGQQRGAAILEVFAQMGLTVLEMGAGRYAEALSWGMRIYDDDPPGFGNRILPEIVEAGARGGDHRAADLPQKQAAVMAATQRPVAAAAFTEINGSPAWKNLPSWAVVATGDKAAGSDVVRSTAQRADATITEVEGSHVIMISQPQVVTDVIRQAIDSLAR